MDIKTEVPDAELESIQLKVEFIEEHQDPQISSSEVSLFTFKKEVEEILTMESSGIAEDKNKSSEGNLSARGVNTEGQRSTGAPLGSADSLPSATHERRKNKLDGITGTSTTESGFGERRAISSQLPQSIAVTRTAERVISQPNHCCCKEVMESIKKLEAKVDKLTKIALKKDNAAQKTSVGSFAVMPLAANNLDELRNLASHPQLIDMLKPFVGVNTGDTIRRIFKRAMSQELAVQFSYTGLGKNRQREKQEFRVHPFCVRIINGATELGMKASKAELVQVIQATLRGARDWHGKRRSTKLEAPSGSDEDASQWRISASDIGSGDEERMGNPEELDKEH